MILISTIDEKKPVLTMKAINKIFPGVHALKNVDFELFPGEVHGLVGENGAGKSTLMNVMGGVFSPTSGKIFLDNNEVSIETSRKAEELGISFVHQELSLFRNLDIATNLYVHHLPKKNGFLDKKRLFKDTGDILNSIKLAKRPQQLVGHLKIGEQQLVEIGRSLAQKTRILVLDEPTSSLTKPEIRVLFDLIKSLKSKGVAIVFITHRLDEIYDVCDKITIMRDGEKLLTSKLEDIERGEIISNMIGRQLHEFYEHETHVAGEVLLELKGVSRKDKLENISFEIRKGEIVGLYGLMGSGRTEIVRSIFGLDKIDSGEIFIEGRKKSIKKPLNAINNGVAMVSEDRHLEGLVLTESVKYNISLANLKSISKRKAFVDSKKEIEIANKNVKNLNIKTPTINRMVKFLSGGNQQKVVIAKWLNTSPKLLLMDEPTRGVDVGAKREIYKIIDSLVMSGVGIFLVSSELPELLGLCDRVLVIKEGRINANLEKLDITTEKLLSAAMGG